MRLSRGKKMGLVISAAVLCASLYAGTMALRWLRLYWPGLPGGPFWLLWLLPEAAFSLTAWVPRGFWKSLCRRVGEIWISLALYPFALAMLAGCVSAVMRLWGRALPLRAAGWGVLAVSARVFAYAVPRALYPRVVRYTVPLPGLTSPVRAVLLADLHLGFFTPRSLLPRLRDMVNREAPDLVLIAGDIFDEEYAALRRPEEAAAALRDMASPLGTFACEGNHDNYCPSPEAEDFCRRAGITLLRDAWTDAGPLRLGGRLDCRRDRRQSVKDFLAAGEKEPRVVLDHNPRDWEKLLAAGAGLVACGHTHGGQTFPGNLAARLLLRCPVYGRREAHGGTCIITSGAGIWGLPLRLGVTGEIAVLSLTPGTDAAESERKERK